MKLIKLGQEAEITRGAPKSRMEESGDAFEEVGLVQAANLSLLGIEGGLTFARVAHHKLRQYRLLRGDILISLLDVSNASLRVGLVQEADMERTLVAGANVAIVRLRSDALERDYLALYLRSNAAARQLYSARAGTAQSYLNIVALGDIDIPMPSREQQHQMAELHLSYERYALETQRLLGAERQLLQAQFEQQFGGMSG